MKYGIIKNVLPLETCEEMSELMESLVAHSGKNEKNNANDYYGIFNTIQLKIQPVIENAFGFELIPTYNFSRIYNTNSRLGKHTDRPSCECSVTLNLKNEKGSWPIWVHHEKVSEAKAFDLQPGDLVWYKGMEITHWREPNVEGKVYQSFFHYVKKDGKHSNWAYDKNYERWKKDLDNPLYHINF